MNVLHRSLCAAALALSASTASAGAYSGVYVFGDSLADSGNNYLVFQNGPLPPPLGAVPTPRPDAVITTPTPLSSNTFIPTLTYAPAAPYPFGTYSNGQTWVGAFGAALGLTILPSLAGGTNYADGGATTGGVSAFPPSLGQQVDQFVALPGSAPSDALYVIAGGGNDVRAVLNAITPSTTPAEVQAAILAASLAFAQNVVGMIVKLADEGADDFVVWNVPNAGIAPAIALQGPASQSVGTLTSSTMNAYLAAALAMLPPQIASDVRVFDLFGLVTGAVATPAAFGFDNVTLACGANPGACTDPSKWLFWDGIHPTSGGHALISEAMLARVPLPATLPLLAIGVAGLWLRRRRAA
jgi:phospholipase/lecithinase/hemolysin